MNSQANTFVRNRKVALFGARAVGKTSLCASFIVPSAPFAESYSPTIENKFNKSLRLAKVEYIIDLIDTGGQDETSLIGPGIGIHGYLIVAAANSESSVWLVDGLCIKIIETTGLSVPIVIVFNKCDLKES